MNISQSEVASANISQCHAFWAGLPVRLVLNHTNLHVQYRSNDFGQQVILFYFFKVSTPINRAAFI